MLTGFIIFISQLILVFFKHIAIRAIAQHRIGLTAVYTAVIQSAWLVSSALGINALLKGDWFVVAAYITGGVVGSFLQFKFQIKQKDKI